MTNNDPSSLAEQKNIYKDKHVLVTGGTGFVGGYFVSALLELGARIRVPIHTRPMLVEHPNLEIIQADLTVEADALKACEGIDYVIHCAGAAAGVGLGAAGLMQGLAINTILAMRCLHAAWTQNVERILIFSSSTGYPVVDHPVREEEFWEGDVFPGYFGYGWMRRYMERLGEFVQKESSTKVTIIRPVAIYGPGDNFDPNSSHVIPALIRRAVAGEVPFTVWGKPDVIRDFLHVKDLARGSLLAMEKLGGADPVNIAWGQETTIKQIVETIFTILKRDPANIIYDEDKPTAIPYRAADISKAKRELGFYPEISLEDGLQETINWYLAQQQSQH
ncbi:MAG: NAD-dependent epimerase/dehydratase family protein [Alphaproteobacteria bacterium]|nr:NAD-dependent epimerase/dehydratase family protein [Alphaproteobacteria bacterium]